MRRWLPWIAAVLAGSALGSGAAAVAWHQRHQAALDGPSGPPPRAGAARAVSEDRPNVIVVVGCSLRRDQLTPYGGPAGVTPFLATLAERGARFTGAIAAAPWTRPAMASIVSGRAFRGIGMAEPGPRPSRRKLAAEVATLADDLHAGGWWTIGATASPHLARTFGFDQGFDRWHDPLDLWTEGTSLVPGSVVVDKALREIDRRQVRDAPVYVQLTLEEGHAPIGLSDAEVGSFADPVSPSRVHRHRALARRFDDVVHRLWNGLAARGFDDDNTVFVVLGDHGEGLSWPPEHGSGHGNLLVPSVLDVPWIVRGRGAGRGVVIEGLASHVDVRPTILGLAGLSPSEGHDWSALAATGGRTHRPYAFADTDHLKADRSAVVTEGAACEVNRRFEAPVVRCFDRVADPNQRKPIGDPDPALVDELLAWRAAEDAAAAAWPYGADAAPTAADRAILDALDVREEGD